jgi:hypothetical protein
MPDQPPKPSSQPKPEQSNRPRQGSRRLIPYAVEMIIDQESQPPKRHYVSVYANGELYVIELNKEYPPTSTGRIGFYGQHWIITKSKEDESVTRYVITFAGGNIERYVVPTRMARKLQNDIAVYEAQQEKGEGTAKSGLNTNQHYISQVLLRRFSTHGRIQKYTMKYGKWSASAPRSVFSGFGYNQLLAFGKFNNDVDDRLKYLEDTLPATLAALDNAVAAKETTLEPEIYHRLCLYCAFLWQISPFSKLAAPINFVHQLMLDLSVGNVDMLEAIGVKDEDIAQIRRHYSNGAKFIITGKNYQQLAYRLQFSKQLESLYRAYRYSTKWSIARSPIELPIGDMALIKYAMPDLNVIRSILPISSNSILIGEFPMRSTIVPDTNTTVYGTELTQSGAEYVRDVVCQAALLAVASNSRIGNINEWRKRPVVNLLQLQNVDAILRSGLVPIESAQDFLITPASTEDYVKWTHSFLKPHPNKIM